MTKKADYSGLPFNAQSGADSNPALNNWLVLQAARQAGKSSHQPDPLYNNQLIRRGFEQQ